MDILGIFDQLKKKGLDVVQIDLLKNAYELQNKNIEQLEKNNASLRESNDLLKEKVNQLEDSVVQLRSELDVLKKKLPVDRSGSFSDDALAALKVCSDRDLTEFYEGDMISLLQKGAIIAKKIMGELHSNGLITQSKAITDDRGAGFRVTQKGLETIANLSSNGVARNG